MTLDELLGFIGLCFGAVIGAAVGCDAGWIGLLGGGVGGAVAGVVVTIIFLGLSNLHAYLMDGWFKRAPKRTIAYAVVDVGLVLFGAYGLLQALAHSVRVLIDCFQQGC